MEHRIYARVCRERVLIRSEEGGSSMWSYAQNKAAIGEKPTKLGLPQNGYPRQQSAGNCTIFPISTLGGGGLQPVPQSGYLGPSILTMHGTAGFHSMRVLPRWTLMPDSSVVAPLPARCRDERASHDEAEENGR